MSFCNQKSLVLMIFSKLKDGADYAAYKESTSDPLPKFKFRSVMIDEFKNVLMQEIAPLLE